MIEEMILNHYNEGLTPASIEKEMVYQLKVVYTELFMKHADGSNPSFHYYATPNNQILIDLAWLMIHHSLDIESIEITKV